MKPDNCTFPACECDVPATCSGADQPHTTPRQTKAQRLADALASFHNPHDQEAAAELRPLDAENKALRGLMPELPPRPPHNNDASYQHPALPRYGLRWNGPGLPVSTPMADGYWTPFHLALAAIEAERNEK